LDYSASLMCYDLHRGMLYGWRDYEKVVDAEPKRAIDIMRFDMNTGEMQLLLSVETTEANSQPSLFFFGDYVYYCYDTWIAEYDPETEELLSGEGTLWVGRIDTVTLENELLFRQTKDGGFGSGFTLWVESEDRIYLVPGAPVLNEEGSNVYLLSGGELSIVHTFGGMGAAFVVDGGAVMFYPAESHMEIWSFDGAEIYNGEWQTEFEDENGDKYTVTNLDTPYGDMNTLYFIYTLRKQGAGAGSWMPFGLVRYDMTQGELQPELLIISPDVK
ncbi:MAG: hypothetical protein J5544_00405, partial [Clostridia bacterium]|nr:hypothetical protein [Clostridia bacterium]